MNKAIKITSKDVKEYTKSEIDDFIAKLPLMIKYRGLYYRLGKSTTYNTNKANFMAVIDAGESYYSSLANFISTDQPYLDNKDSPTFGAFLYYDTSHVYSDFYSKKQHIINAMKYAEYDIDWLCDNIDEAKAEMHRLNILANKIKKHRGNKDECQRN